MFTISLHTLLAAVAVLGIDGSAAMPVPPGMPAAAAGSAGDDQKPDFPPFDEVTKDMKVREGYFTLYQDEKKDRLLARVSKDKCGKPFLGATSIARGPMFAGWQWVDAPMYWDRHGKQLILMLAEPRYVKGKGSPVEDVIARTYMDTILRAVPIVTEAEGDPVIDLADLLKADIIELNQIFEGRVDRSLSRFGDVKNFEKNTEISVNLAMKAVPQGPPGTGMMPGALADAQVVTVHYSFSQLPDPAKDDYQPRVADSRVGYFLTVVKDWTADHNDKTIFKRFINRWRLRKAEPDQEVSDVLPEDQIVFFIEKTVPVKYRQYVREGILDWNKAFEKAGLRNAIVVLQQTEKNEYKDLDPEDVRYNFFRWIVSGVAYAMGPSRANPYTGQILDADIVFDDALVRYLQMEYDLNAPRSIGGLTDAHLDEFLTQHADWKFPLETLGIEAKGPRAIERLRDAAELQPWGNRHSSKFCELGIGATRQLALAAYTAAAAGQRSLPDEYIGQVIKEISAHEVGHTLGLRHNFKASSWLKLADIKCCKAEENRATSGSVMDYNPAWYAPTTMDQGVFVTPTVGPYDYWAIEYGYRPFGGGKGAGRGAPPATKDPKTDLASSEKKDASVVKVSGTDGVAAVTAKPEGAKPEGDGKPAAEPKKDAAPATEADMLKAIASRCAESGLAYATDEDTFFAAPDPTSNRFDHGADPLEWGRERMGAISRLWKDGLDWSVKDGQGWSLARRALYMLLGEYTSAAYFSARVVGGQYSSRDHKGDPNARPPVVPVSAEKQREAISMLSDKVWSDAAFQFSPKLLNSLAPGRWYHWDTDNLDVIAEFNIHEEVRFIRWLTLFQLMNPFTLNRVYDSERLVPESQDVLTVPDVLSIITRTVWSELEKKPERNPTNREPWISSYRRALQRDHVQMLIDMVLARPGLRLYADVHSVARLTLNDLGGTIERALADQGARLDDFSRAHLTDSRQRIKKALEAEFTANALGRNRGQAMIIGKE